MKLKVCVCADASLLRHCCELLRMVPDIPGFIFSSSCGGAIRKPCATTPIHGNVFGCILECLLLSVQKWAFLVLHVPWQEGSLPVLGSHLRVCRISAKSKGTVPVHQGLQGC